MELAHLYTTRCTSDVNYCAGLFNKSLSDSSYWGVTRKNDYAEIIFQNITFFITSYTIRGPNYANLPKGILVQGIKNDATLYEIDNITESTIKSRLSEQTRKIKCSQSFIGLRFTVFDTWEQGSDWYSGIQRIKIFGYFGKRAPFDCTMKRRFSTDNRILVLNIE